MKLKFWQLLSIILAALWFAPLPAYGNAPLSKGAAMTDPASSETTSSETNRAEVASTVDVLLAQADQIRSADRVGFNRLMQQLDAQKNQMSAAQFEYLQLLTGYQSGIDGDAKQAETILNQLINTAESIDIRFRAAFTLANIQSIHRNFIPAFTNLNLALSWIDKISNQEHRTQVLISAAYTYSESGLIEESQSYLQQAKNYQLGSRDQCLINLLYRQNLHATNSTYPESLVHETAQVCQQAKEALALLFIHLLDAQRFEDTKDFRAAFQLLQSHLQAAEATKYPRLISEYYLALARIARAQQQQTIASEYLDKIHAMAPSLGHSLILVRAYEMHTQLAHEAQDFISAFKYQQLFQKADRALVDEKAEQQIAYQLAKGELLKMNQQLALVEEKYRVVELENALKIQESKHTKQLIALLITLSIGLVYVAYRLLRRHQFYKHAAENDALTQISNRFHFESQFHKQLKRCKQLHKPVGLILFDLDHFTEINDTFGNEAGDRTLQAVVKLCNHFMRSDDLFGRIGGEAFAIALPDCQPDKVMMLAEICRDAIEHLDCSHINSGLKVSASFGVSFSQTSGYSATELLHNADEALFMAKQLGRNKVECYTTQYKHASVKNRHLPPDIGAPSSNNKTRG